MKIRYFFLGEKSVITIITDFSPIHDIIDFYILIYYSKIVRLKYLMRVIFLEGNIISHDTNNRFNSLLNDVLSLDTSIPSHMVTKIEYEMPYYLTDVLLIFQKIMRSMVSKIKIHIFFILNH